MKNLPPLTKRQLWDEINVMGYCARHFGLPRIAPRGWKRYQGIVRIDSSVQPKGSEMNYFWWSDKTFQVFTRQIPMKDQAHMGDVVLTCKVVGSDMVLHIYTIEIIGGDQDGTRFEVGFGWLDQYIKPDVSDSDGQFD